MKRVSLTTNAVSLFRQGAEITCRAQVELSKGRETLYLSGLSSSADTRTARLFCDPAIHLSNLRIITGEGGEKESDAIQKQIDSLEKENAARELQKHLWELNGDFTNRTSVNSGEIEAYISALPNRLSLIQKNIEECSNTIEDLTKKKETLLEREQRPIMAADIECDADGVYLIELRYMEPNASWSQVYEIHSDGSSPLELRFRASIHQESGEDWKDVSLRLYTGNPSGNHTLPVLNPKYADLMESTPVRNFAASANGFGAGMMMGAAMDSSAVGDIAPVRAETAPVEETEDLTMREYDLGEGNTIRCENEETVVDLLKYTIPAVYEIKTVPAEDPSAYLTAKVKTADLPDLLSDNAKVYLSGMVLGEVMIHAQDEAEEQILSLGRNEMIHVSYKCKEQKRSRTILKGESVTESAYETVLRNTSSQEVTVTVQNQIPLSANKQITIEPINLDSYTRKEDTGFIHARVTLKPQESRTLIHSYRMSWPKDRQITYKTVHSNPKFCPECGSPLQSSSCSVCGWSQ